MRARRNKVGKTAIKVFFSFLSTAIYFVLFIVESFSSSALNIFLLCRKSFFLSLAHFFLAFAISSHPHTIDWGFSRLREREGAKKSIEENKVFHRFIKAQYQSYAGKGKTFLRLPAETVLVAADCKAKRARYRMLLGDYTSINLKLDKEF